ncbi:MAG: FAD-dependent oxidoreductase [Planktomarina sp.]|nr:FAD-dependent oxidoreductase [Planktomarina sp.]MDT2050563.1 FAD-dependent oxidoreductase [Planktomarina sp.]
MVCRILILGGGFAGLYAARNIQRLMGRNVDIEIVNRENYFVFQPLLPEVAGGAISAVNAVSPLRFLTKGISMRKAEIDSIDPTSQTVTVFQGVQRRPTILNYDHLIIALGSGSDLSRTPGLHEHAFTMKTLSDAQSLRAHIIERLEHADVTRLPEVKKGALTFTVIGGGFSGIETVGEIKELIDRSLRYYPNIKKSEIRVVVLEFADRILNEMPESLAKYAQKNLTRRGIEIQLGVGVSGCTGTQLVTTADEIIDTRTIVATIGNSPSSAVSKMPLTFQHGRILVGRDFRVHGHQNIWSIGDCALIPMKEDASHRDDFAPPTAQFAVQEAKQIASNIKAAIGRQPLEAFKYTSKGSLASLGAGRGVAEIFGIKLTGRTAWLLWRVYYLAFLPGMQTRISVLWNWLMDWFSSRSVVQINSEKQHGVRDVLYRAGDRIYETGARADGFYTIVSGSVRITGIDENTGKETSRVLGVGEHFGERLLKGATRRIATAVAVDDTKVLGLTRDEFLKLAEGLPFFHDYFENHLEASGLGQVSVLSDDKH